MRILIVGAGGVGGYFGAYLLQAGRDATFLVRPQRAQQLRIKGLQLESPGGNVTIANPKTVLASDLRGPYDLILLSCKAWDLEASMRDFAPAVGPQTSILPLLNGMSQLDTLDQRFGREHVLGGDTTISAVKADDGRILHLNKLDTLHFGDRDQPESPRILAIAKALTVPGYHAELCPDIVAAMWHKWVTISTGAGSTCLMRATIGDIVAAGAAPIVTALLAETSSIATAAGYPPTQHFLDTTIAKFTQPGSLFTASMFRDIEAGGPIECEHIFGDLLGHARHLHLRTPLLEVVYAHLRSYEERRNREAQS